MSDDRFRLNPRLATKVEDLVCSHRSRTSAESGRELARMNQEQLSTEGTIRDGRGFRDWASMVTSMASSGKIL